MQTTLDDLAESEKWTGLERINLYTASRLAQTPLDRITEAVKANELRHVHVGRRRIIQTTPDWLEGWLRCRN